VDPALQWPSFMVTQPSETDPPLKDDEDTIPAVEAEEDGGPTGGDINVVGEEEELDDVVIQELEGVEGDNSQDDDLEDWINSI
jgi:hypothetical protein